MSNSGSHHEPYMLRALALAKKGVGYVSPNPMVGAVIVNNGRIVGEGYHRQAGGPHAEVEAIRDARGETQGATLYVTLEPCCHFGKTPPCTQAVIEAGIAQVVYAVSDPNPRVSGGGHAQLAAAGIQMTHGILEEAAQELNRAFFHFIQTGLPYVIAKFAMSLDGKIASRTGDSRWVSSIDSRLEVMHLRHQTDAILVGGGTVRMDNPRLTTRIPDHPSPRHPLRVILDHHEGLTADAALFQPDMPGKTLLCTARQPKHRQLADFHKQGVEVWHFPPGPEGHIPLPALLKRLGERQITSLLVEGGSQVHGAFFDYNLVQEVWAFLAPKIIGGHQAPQPVGGTGISQMADALQGEWREVRRIGPDLLLRLKPIARPVNPEMAQT